MRQLGGNADSSRRAAQKPRRLVLALAVAIAAAIVLVPSAVARSSLTCCVTPEWTVTFDAETWTMTVSSTRPSQAPAGGLYVCLNRVFVGTGISSTGQPLGTVYTPGPAENQCGSSRTSFGFSFVISAQARDRLESEKATRLYVQLEFYIARTDDLYYLTDAKTFPLPARDVCCVESGVAVVYDPDDKGVDAGFEIPGKKLCAEQIDLGTTTSSARVVSRWRGRLSRCDSTAARFDNSTLADVLDVSGTVYAQVQYLCNAGTGGTPPADDCRGARDGAHVFSTIVRLRLRKKICCSDASTSAIYDPTAQRMYVRWTLPSQKTCAKYVLFGAADGGVVNPTGRGDVGCDTGETSATFTRAFDAGISVQVQFQCRAGTLTSGPSADCDGGYFGDWLYGKAAQVCYAADVRRRREADARAALRDGGCRDAQIAVTQRCDAGTASVVLEEKVDGTRISLVVSKKCLQTTPQRTPPAKQAQPEQPKQQAAPAQGFDGDYTGLLEWTGHTPGKPDVKSAKRFAFSVEGGAIEGPGRLKGIVAKGGKAEGAFVLKGYPCKFVDVAFVRRGEAVDVRGEFECRDPKIVNRVTGKLRAKRTSS